LESSPCWGASCWRECCFLFDGTALFFHGINGIKKETAQQQSLFPLPEGLLSRTCGSLQLRETAQFSTMTVRRVERERSERETESLLLRAGEQREESEAEGDHTDDAVLSSSFHVRRPRPFRGASEASGGTRSRARNVKRKTERNRQREILIFCRHNKKEKNRKGSRAVQKQLQQCVFEC